MKKWFAAAALVAIVTAAVAGALVYRVRTAEAAWAQTFGPIDRVPEQFRPAVSNSRAADLALWSKRVTPPDPRVQTAVFDYLTNETASAASRAKPDPTVLHFQPEEVDAFAKWVTDEPPVFARVIHSPNETVPNLLGVMRLQKTMLAVAVARAAVNDDAGAERLLDASWTLNDALRRGPTMIEQLIALAVYRYQLGALRKMNASAEKWVPRIRSVDSLASIATIARMEAWYIDRAVRQNTFASATYLGTMREIHASLADGVVVNSRLVQLVRTPIRWFDLPSVLEGDRTMIVAAATVPRSARIDSDLLDAWQRGAAKWAYVSDRDVEKMNWTTAFPRAVRADAEGELTQKVLLARAGKFEPSSRIARAKWIQDGSAIHLNHMIIWGGNMLGPSVQMRYDLR